MKHRNRILVLPGSVPAGAWHDRAPIPAVPGAVPIWVQVRPAGHICRECWWDRQQGRRQGCDFPGGKSWTFAAGFQVICFKRQQGVTNGFLSTWLFGLELMDQQTSPFTGVVPSPPQPWESQLATAWGWLLKAGHTAVPS